MLAWVISLLFQSTIALLQLWVFRCITGVSWFTVFVWTVVTRKLYGKLTVNANQKPCKNWFSYITNPIHLPLSSMQHHHFPTSLSGNNTFFPPLFSPIRSQAAQWGVGSPLPATEMHSTLSSDWSPRSQNCQHSLLGCPTHTSADMAVSLWPWPLATARLITI